METKEKIIKILEENPSGLSISEIGRKTDLHRNTISPNVTELLEKGELKYKMVGQAKVYYLSHDQGLHGGIKMTEEKNFYAGVGISKNDDPYQAGKEAAEMALTNCEKTPNFGVVFCSGSKYGRDDASIADFVKGVNEALIQSNPSINWIGCTTSGELSSYGFSQGSVVVAVLSSKYLKFSIAASDNLHSDPTGIGAQTAKRVIGQLSVDKFMDPYIHYLAMKKKNTDEMLEIIPCVLITICSGVLSTLPPVEAEFLEGIKSVLGTRIPIIGGSAADDGQLVRTYQFTNGKIYKDGLIVAAMFSDLKIGFGLEHGYEPTGKVAYVSEVTGNGHTVKTLDNKPAVDVLAEWLGKTKQEMMSTIKLPTGAEISIVNVIAQKTPLAIMDHGKFNLKVPVNVTPDGGIVFAAKVEEHSALYLLHGDVGTVLDASGCVIHNALSDYKIRNPAFGLFFDCALRWYILGPEAEKEVNSIKDILKVPFVGFYTYGEHGARKGAIVDIHNQTLTGLIISNELYTE